MKIWVRIAVVLVGISLIPLGAALGQLTVSPGSPDGVTWTSSRCPTFIWGSVVGAVAYELVVYELSEEQSVAEDPPLLQRLFPAAVTAWTPPLDLCLAAGRRYAWSIKVTGARGEPAWSQPSLFGIQAAPSIEELSAALAVVEQYAASWAQEPDHSSERAELARAVARVKESTAASFSPVPSVPFTNTIDNTGLMSELAPGTSNNAAVYGRVTPADGNDLQVAVYGEVFGSETITDFRELIVGVWGFNTSGLGAGVRGESYTDPPTGSADGVQGFSNSPSGAGGYFLGNDGALALDARGDTYLGGDVWVAGDLTLGVPGGVDLLLATSVSLPSLGFTGAGHNSGLDADLLDGLHGADLAPAVHSHPLPGHGHPVDFVTEVGVGVTSKTVECGSRGTLIAGGCQCAASSLVRSGVSDDEQSWQCDCDSRTDITATAVCQ